MSDNLNIYLVSVEYGNKNGTDFHKIYKSIESHYNCKIIRVRTDQRAGRFVSSINEAFEFSGYQEGLEIAIHDCKMRNDFQSPNSRCTFVFVNDTWLPGHLSSLGLLLIKHMLLLRHIPGDLPAFVGLKMPVNDAICSITGGKPYISTWAFGLIGSLNDMQKVSFYNEGEVFGGFRENCLQYFSDDYKHYLKSWLQPTSLLKGWYKTIPGIPLEESVFTRKSLTIYLEHSLPGRLALQGFHITDICETLTPFKAALIKALRKIDRLNVVYLKLRVRIPVFLALLKKSS
jgi:hypothetical protein